jgi:photosystem II stability/assembly factor-like uncharacterized protein
MKNLFYCRYIALFILALSIGTACSTSSTSPKTNTWESAKVSLFSYNIHMQNDQQGWAFGKGAIDSGGAEIWSTRDSGTEWFRIWPESQTKLPDTAWGESLTEAHFAFWNTDSIWVVQSEADRKTVYFTADSGESWTRGGSVFSGGSLLGLSFASPVDGWMTLESKAGLGYSIAEVYRTKDGGLTWEPASSVAEGSIPMEGNKTAASFADSANGFMGTGGITEGPVLYRTKNSGSVWLNQSLPITDGNARQMRYDTTPPVFFGPKEGILEMNSFNPQSEETALWFYSTKDGGDSWVPVKANLEIDGDKPFLLQYDFISLQDGWLTVDGDTLYKSEGNAQSWKPVQAVKKIPSASAASSQ